MDFIEYGTYTKKSKHTIYGLDWWAGQITLVYFQKQF